jgi:hypothetical protein
MSVVVQVWCAPWSVKEESMAMLRNQERTPKEKRNTPTLYVLHLLMSSSGATCLPPDFCFSELAQ